MKLPITATLDSIERLSNRLIILHFNCEAKPGGQGLTFVPGQFVKLGLNDGKPFQRSYSIATADKGDLYCAQHLEIACSYVEKGRASDLLFKAKPGLKVEVHGPFGQFILPRELPRRLWLVATGTGVAPYKPMLRQLESVLGQQKVSVNLVIGIRDSRELLYSELWRHYANKYPTFKVYFCYSQETSKEPKTDEFSGRVQSVIHKHRFIPGEELFYLCGTPAMVDDLYQYFKNVGFGVKEIRREKYVYAAIR